MTTLLIAVLVLQTVVLVILIWTLKASSDERARFQKLLTENLGKASSQQETLQITAEHLTASSEKIGGMAGDLQDLGAWARTQKDLQVTEERFDQDLLAEFQGEKEHGAGSGLPPSLITEVMLSKKVTVVAALTRFLDEVYDQITGAIASRDYRQSEDILAKLHLVLERNLFKCPWNDLVNLYKRARHLTIDADEKAVAAIQALQSVEEAMTLNVPERLLLLSFPKEDVDSARTRLNITQAKAAFEKLCEDLRSEASGIDPTSAQASLRLSQVELRFAHVLSSQPRTGGVETLAKTSEAIRLLKTKCQFFGRLNEAKVTEAGIKAAFDRLLAVKKELSQEIIHGYVFEEIDKAMATAAVYLTIVSELNTGLFDDTCHAISQKEFLEIKTAISEKQYKAYNLWALRLITETKKKLKEREPSIPRPTFDYKAMVSELFPLVYNHVDESLINPSVSRLYYDLHGKLIDIVKKHYDLVRNLIEGQISHPKVTIYQLNDDLR
jgi:hypothetical protein